MTFGYSLRGIMKPRPSEQIGQIVARKTANINLDFPVDTKDHEQLAALLGQKVLLRQAFQDLCKQADSGRDIVALWAKRSGSLVSQTIATEAGLEIFMSHYLANDQNFGLFFRAIIPRIDD